MRNFLILMTIMLALITGGCSLPAPTPQTENYTAFAARSAGDAAITIVADKGKLDQSDMAIIAACAGELEDFLATGKADSLTSGKLADEITAQIPAQYQQYFTIALTYLNGSTVDVTALVPAKTLRLVRNAIHGVYTGASYWLEPIDVTVPIPSSFPQRNNPYAIHH